MAQRVHVMLTCDLHEDEVEGSETLTFSLDGTAYDIDVCEAHATQMREIIGEYIALARCSGRRRVTRVRVGSTVKPPASDRERTQAIRDWARGQGLQVSDRGRLSAAVITAYDLGHA